MTHHLIAGPQPYRIASHDDPLGTDALHYKKLYLPVSYDTGVAKWEWERSYQLVAFELWSLTLTSSDPRPHPIAPHRTLSQLLFNPPELVRCTTTSYTFLFLISPHTASNALRMVRQTAVQVWLFVKNKMNFAWNHKGVRRVSIESLAAFITLFVNIKFNSG